MSFSSAMTSSGPKRTQQYDDLAEYEDQEYDASDGLIADRR